MFMWYMTTIDSFYSEYKRGIFTKVGFCVAVTNIIELARHETDLTTGQFKYLLTHKHFLENEVMGL